MKKTKRTKQEKIAILSTVGFGLLGVTAFVVGYGLKDGWKSVLMWFVSRWAVYVYIAIILLLFIVIYVVHKKRMED